MTLLDRMPRRWRSLGPEIAKFGTIGGINTVLDFAIFNLLMAAGLPALKSNVASTVVATTSSYVMNRRWTYSDRPRRAVRREYSLFFAFNLVGLAIQLAVLGTVKYGFGAAEGDHWLAFNVAKALAIAVAMVFRFWAYRTFVFRTEPTTLAWASAEPTTLAWASAEPTTLAHASADGSALIAQPDVDSQFAELTSDLEAEFAPDQVLSRE